MPDSIALPVCQVKLTSRGVGIFVVFGHFDVCRRTLEVFGLVDEGGGGVDLNILHNEDRCVDELMMSLWGFLIREDFYLILLWETVQVPFID